MINGNGLKLQLGIEGTYATVAAGTNQIKVSSEGFKYKPNKKDEGVLTGGKSNGRVQTMSKSTEGSFSTIVRPDDAGLYFGLTLGEEGTPALVDGATSAYAHTFTSIGTDESDSLPSVTAIVDRIARVYAYNGCKVGSASFSAQPEDFFKLDLSLNGRDEATGTLATLTPSPLKAFKFAQASVKLAGTTVADVTSIKFDYNNNLDVSTQTTSTGDYYAEYEAGSRDITAEIEVLYSTASDAIRESYFKTDDDLSLEIVFTSDEEIETGVPYSLTISIPHMQVTECSPTIGGSDTVKQSMSLKAIEEGSDELITVELVNARATTYI